MNKQARLSVGDSWTYEKSFPRKRPKIIVGYRVVGSEKIEEVNTLIIEWEERLRGREVPLISGKFWIDEETDRFVKGERTFHDESGGMLETEHLGKFRLGNWGIKGHARAPESLKVGERWSFEDHRRLNQVSVTGLEETRVPAGEFECYVVETEVRKDGLEFTFRSWYSKRLGILVKSVARNPEGTTTGETKLFSYVIKESK
ncbi:MAG: hypothetical protein U9M97_02685 [Candidatus Hadarchaeota archaeon]|nr:hypothetical protein [Candidatus Hadarchaeota archaeon]